MAELLATDLAAVRFFSGVQSHVELPRQNGLKGFPAEGTGFTLQLVCLQVSNQVGSGVQPHAAETAAAVGVLSADLQDVFEQEPFPLQRAAAHVTAKTLSWS